MLHLPVIIVFIFMKLLYIYHTTSVCVFMMYNQYNNAEATLSFYSGKCSNRINFKALTTFNFFNCLKLSYEHFAKLFNFFNTKQL